MFAKEEITKIIARINTYSAGCIGKPEEQPLVVVGPSGGKSNLRIYCYGGSAGCLGAEEIEDAGDNEIIYGLISSGYERYLRRYFKDMQGAEYILSDNLRKKYEGELADVPKESRCEKKKYLNGKEKPDYIPGLDEDFLKETQKGTKDIYMELLKQDKRAILK